MKNKQINPSQYHSALGLDRGDIFSPDSWLSKSTVWELYQSSLYRWRYHPKQYQTKAMNWGSLVDCLVTSPQDFDNQFTISPYDSFRTKEAREWKAEQLESGISIITEEDRDNAEKAASVLTQVHKIAAGIIERSAKQVVMLNKVQLPNVKKPIQLKALADFVPDGKDYIADLKTTADFSADGFSKTISRYGYASQASHYLNMHNMLNPDDQRTRFLIIWQQSCAPYEVAVTELPKVDIDDGARIFNFLLGKIAKAAELDYWPPMFKEVALIGRAPYSAFADEQEMEGYTAAPTI